MLSPSSTARRAVHAHRMVKRADVGGRGLRGAPITTAGARVRSTYDNRRAGSTERATTKLVARATDGLTHTEENNLIRGSITDPPLYLQHRFCLIEGENRI